ncbi:hypothetical protein C8Q77DRAFT_1116215 [Trametes polyzona]|nr:hypothetical protein C8Q77DRAFT_1116215 [Trametes polyzona]
MQPGTRARLPWVTFAPKMFPISLDPPTISPQPYKPPSTSSRACRRPPCFVQHARPR